MFFLSMYLIAPADLHGQVTTGVSNNFHPSLPPDGSKIIFHDHRDGNEDIYITNSNGTGEQRLTFDPAFDSNMSFSPDGSTIVYESFVGEVTTARIYVMDVDGLNQKQLTH